MKTILTLASALLLGTALASPARAEDGNAQGGHKGNRRARLEKLFHHFDKNGDKQLTADEVPEKVWARVSKADADGDGAVTKKELADAIKARRGKGRGEGRGRRGAKD